MARGDNLKEDSKATRFPHNDPTKGGAPKGKRVTTILKELLGSDLSSIIDNPNVQGMEGNKALAVQLLTLAFHKESASNEKLSAIKEILDRIEGKPKQTIDQTNTERKVTIMNSNGKKSEDDDLI